MHLNLWNIITSATAQVRSLTEGSLSIVKPEKNDPNAALTMISVVPPDLLGSLRGKLKEHLAQLEAQLQAHLSESETYQVLLPLVIHCDEQVLRRLPIREQPSWPLLQRERFQIDDGGDVFYQLIDERLQKSDTAPLVFEVLYFCLSDGFLGRFASDPTKIVAYKARLAARIPMPRMPAQNRRGRRRSERRAGSPAALDESSAQSTPASTRGRGSGQNSTVSGTRDGSVGSTGARGASARPAAAGSAGPGPGAGPYPPAPPAHPLWLYGATLLLILVTPFVVVFLSNL